MFIKHFVKFVFTHIIERFLKVIIQLRKSEVKVNSRRHSFIRWNENPRAGGRGGSLQFRELARAGISESRRLHFDETLNNAIHGTWLLNDNLF